MKTSITLASLLLSFSTFAIPYWELECKVDFEGKYQGEAKVKINSNKAKIEIDFLDTSTPMTETLNASAENELTYIAQYEDAPATVLTVPRNVHNQMRADFVADRMPIGKRVSFKYGVYGWQVAGEVDFLCVTVPFDVNTPDQDML